MMNRVAVLYPHRKKMDGSANVLCLNCLATIAMEQEGEDTAAVYVPQHICTPWLPSGRENARCGPAS
jgi:hypothetical protein